MGCAARVVLALMAGVLLWMSYVGISEYFLYQHGQQLERSIETEQVTDLNDIWNKWSELSRGHESSL